MNFKFGLNHLWLYWNVLIFTFLCSAWNAFSNNYLLGVLVLVQKYFAGKRSVLNTSLFKDTPISLVAVRVSSLLCMPILSPESWVCVAGRQGSSEHSQSTSSPKALVLWMKHLCRNDWTVLKSHRSTLCATWRSPLQPLKPGHLYVDKCRLNEDLGSLPLSFKYYSFLSCLYIYLLKS